VPAGSGLAESIFNAEIAKSAELLRAIFTPNLD
jgi:hypothetical protein